MRKSLTVLIVLLQVLVLAYMAGEREYILRNGRKIYLRTAPIDPRDLFRGDYVRLNYEISSIPARDLPHKDATKIKKGEKVYVHLKESTNSLYQFNRVSIDEPRSGLYLSGRSSYHYRFHKLGYPLWLKYGIEAYFVQQGKGREMEKRLGSRNKVQVPLEMQIAVGGNGKAVIKDHRWSPIGIGLQVLRTPPPDNQRTTEPLSAKVKLTLANASDAPLALVILPDDCSFSLETSQTAKGKWELSNDPCHRAQPTEDSVLVLQPAEEKAVEFDFSDPRWWVKTEAAQPVEIGTLEWSEQFRMIYRPPNQAATSHLKDRDIIWHGYLPSRAFHGRGRID
jgi:uncharacterized membrane-anchored protein